MRRKRARTHLDEARTWFRLEAAQSLLLARRKESRYGDHATPCLFDDFFNCRSMLLWRFLSREAHGEKERRAQKREVADGIPGAVGRQYGMADSGMALETIWMAHLPKRTGRIEPYVAANGFELPRGE